jgi:hypothetical protein
VPWEWIVQEGRSIEYAPTWDDPEEYAEQMQAWERYERAETAERESLISVLSQWSAISG